jgi:AcrR family transcriptional regulator
MKSGSEVAKWAKGIGAFTESQSIIYPSGHDGLWPGDPGRVVRGRMTTDVKRGVRQRRTQAERSSRTKAKLLEATIELLVEIGYAATSTNDVARRAGLSRGAQVHHFPRKADLVVAAIEHLARKHREILLAKMELLPEDKTRTEVALRSLWEVYRSPLFVASMELRSAARTDPEVRKAQIRMNETLAVPTLNEFCAALLGPVACQDKALVAKVKLCSVFVNGLAIVRSDMGDAWCARQIKVWAEMLSPLIEDARSGRRQQRTG